MEGAVATAATESTATAVMPIAELALESAPSVSVTAVERKTFGLPTRRTMPIGVARRDSTRVANPAKGLRMELVYSAVCGAALRQARTPSRSMEHSVGLSVVVVRAEHHSVAN